MMIPEHHVLQVPRKYILSFVFYLSCFLQNLPSMINVLQHKTYITRGRLNFNPVENGRLQDVWSWQSLNRTHTCDLLEPSIFYVSVNPRSLLEKLFGLGFPRFVCAVHV